MDFGFTEDQHRLRKTIREFTEAEIRPHVMEWDESQKFPLDVFKKLGDMGVLGAVFPEDLGGSGYNYVDYAILMEELARVDASNVPVLRAASLRLCACCGSPRSSAANASATGLAGGGAAAPLHSMAANTNKSPILPMVAPTG